MYDEDKFGPSKTRLKKEADKAQRLGMQLLDFNETFLRSLELEEILLDALLLAKNIRQNSGKRRQVQLIGKLMRRADIDAIETAIHAAHSAKVDDRQQHHRAERLRDSLIKASASERKHILTQLEGSESTDIIRLLKETDHFENASPAYKKASRNLFRQLLELLN